MSTNQLTINHETGERRQELEYAFPNEYEWEDIAEMLQRIDHWGRDRNILAAGGATALSQVKKLKEEIQELEDALLAGDDVKLVDSIGDPVVVLMQICRLAGVSIYEGLAASWEDIKDRQGYMVAGVFVKQKDISLLTADEVIALDRLVDPQHVKDLIDIAKKRHTEQVTTYPSDSPRLT